MSASTAVPGACGRDAVMTIRPVWVFRRPRARTAGRRTPAGSDRRATARGQKFSQNFGSVRRECRSNRSMSMSSRRAPSISPQNRCTIACSAMSIGASTMKRVPGTGRAASVNKFADSPGARAHHDVVVKIHFDPRSACVSGGNSCVQRR